MKKEYVMDGGKQVLRTYAESYGWKFGQPRTSRGWALEMITLIKSHPGAWEALVKAYEGKTTLFRYLLDGGFEVYAITFGVTLSFSDGPNEYDWNPTTGEWEEV